MPYWHGCISTGKLDKIFLSLRFSQTVLFQLLESDKYCSNDKDFKVKVILKYGGLTETCQLGKCKVEYNLELAPV